MPKIFDPVLRVNTAIVCDYKRHPDGYAELPRHVQGGVTRHFCSDLFSDSLSFGHGDALGLLGQNVYLSETDHRAYCEPEAPSEGVSGRCSWAGMRKSGGSRIPLTERIFRTLILLTSGYSVTIPR